MAKSAISFARYFVTASSVALLLSVMLFFAIAPALSFPLTFDQSFQVVKQITPVLIGYLGQCAFYIVKGTKRTATLEIEEYKLLYILAIAPFVIFSVVFVTIIFAFGISNSMHATPGIGMSYPRFTDWIAILLGIFTATISVLTAWMFGGESK